MPSPFLSARSNSSFVYLRKINGNHESQHQNSVGMMKIIYRVKKVDVKKNHEVNRKTNKTFEETGKLLTLLAAV